MKTIESRSAAFKRITKGLKAFVEKQTPAAMQLIVEAKRLEIWKEKYSSWMEYCEKEFGKSRRRVYQLLEIAGTIEEIESVQPLHKSEAKNKAILHDLGTRQVGELAGLDPEQKAAVLDAAIKAEGGKTPKPKTIATARKAIGAPPRRRSCFDPDVIPRDYSGAHLSKPQSESPPRVRSTPADAQVFDEFSKRYPKTFTFEVVTEAEEKQLNVCVEDILANRGTVQTATTQTLISALCAAYKEIKKKTLGVSKADARAMREMFEAYGADEIPNIVEVFKKAIVAPKGQGYFYSNQSHQLHSFGKNYGNIRNEVSNTGNSKNNPRLSGVARNDELNDYGALAAAKSRMGAEMAEAAMRRSSNPKPT